MNPIEQLDAVSGIPDAAMRTWIATRMVELRAEGFAVCFWIVAPDDDVLTVCAQACWGTDHSRPWEEVFAVIEYVEEQPTFFAAVVPAHHEGGLILVLPKASALDPVWRADLTNASIPTA